MSTSYCTLPRAILEQAFDSTTFHLSNGERLMEKYSYVLSSKYRGNVVNRYYVWCLSYVVPPKPWPRSRPAFGCIIRHQLHRRRAHPTAQPFHETTRCPIIGTRMERKCSRLGHLQPCRRPAASGLMPEPSTHDLIQCEQNSAPKRRRSRRRRHGSEVL
jgi:hypothetical protein